MTSLSKGIFTPPERGWVEGISGETYRADSTIVSSGQLKDVLVSPKHYITRRDVASKETPALRFGHLAHVAILEPARFRDSLVIMPDFGDMRSSTNRRVRDEWANIQPESALVMEQEEADTLAAMLNELTAHPMARQLLEQGIPEVSGFWTDESTGLKCRIRPDFLRSDNLMIDYKTTEDARREQFSRSASKFNYPVQAAFYLRGAEAITGQKWNEFIFICQEKEAPYAVSVYRPDEAFMEVGFRRVQRALNALKSARESGIYPSYPAAAQDLSLPAWDFYEEGAIE